MDFRKVAIQSFIGAIFFTIISVILEGEYTQEVWIEKGLNGLLFGLAYALILIIKEKFIKN